MASEGGHATLSAADDFEGALLAHARQTYEHVSAVRLLLGIGWPDLHQAVAAVLGQPAARTSAKDIVDNDLGLGERIFSSAFRGRFEAKGRFRALLQTIPTAVTLTQRARAR